VDATLAEAEDNNTCQSEGVRPADFGASMLLRVFRDAWQEAVVQARRTE